MSHPAFELSFSNLFHWAIFLTLLYNMFDLTRTHIKRGKKVKDQTEIISKYKHIVKEKNGEIETLRKEVEFRREKD